MGKEVVSIHIGQCGVQIGNAIWELLALEHGLNTDGLPVSSQDMTPFERIDCFFYQVKQRFVPRAIMIDLEPTVIDELRTGAYRQFWNPSSLISGKEDAANNFARGYLTTGIQKIDAIAEEIRKMIERTDTLSALEIVHSYAGGTGSGLTALILEHLSDQYGKKFRFSTSIFPSATYSQSTVDPYNSTLFTRASMETVDCNVILDNKSLYGQCAKHLFKEKPTFTLINRLVASLMSSLFLSHRFVYNGTQKADCPELLTNLIPYPRIHFPMAFFSPLYSKGNKSHEQMTVRQITTSLFSQDAATLDCSISDKYFISCAMLYRGVKSPTDVYDAINYVRGPISRISPKFVDWCPSTFKIGLNSWPPLVVPQELIASTPISVCMFAGNVAVADAFCSNKIGFDQMFQKRCFVHWYVGEGLDEDEFVESREEVQTIENDYRSLESTKMVTQFVEFEEEEVVEDGQNNVNALFRSQQQESNEFPNTKFTNQFENSRKLNKFISVNLSNNLNSDPMYLPTAKIRTKLKKSLFSQSNLLAAESYLCRDGKEIKANGESYPMIHFEDISGNQNVEKNIFSFDDGKDSPISEIEWSSEESRKGKLFSSHMR